MKMMVIIMMAMIVKIVMKKKTILPIYWVSILSASLFLVSTT